MDEEKDKEKGKQMMPMSWGRFAAAIAASTLIMFFLMYQLIYTFNHFEFSLNRLLAAFVMAAVMIVVMIGFMWSMFRGKVAKIAVLAVAVLAGVGLLFVNRTQALVNDVQFMEAMIPHHSIAINNARKASISDPRVRELADEIIRSQVLEIEVMKRLLDDIEQDGKRGAGDLPARSTAVTAEMQAEIERAVD